MRKLFVLFLLAVSAASHAIIFPVGVFAVPPPLQETFDTLVAGPYAGFPAFIPAGGTISAFGGPGDLLVGPPVPFLSGPNGCMGDDANVMVTVHTPMQFFGGWFRAVYIGIVPATTLTFQFVDRAGVLIGTVVAPVTGAWTWIGWVTAPKWVQVLMTSNAGIPGLVAMDNLRVLP
jgi:hypothetical protein